MPTRNFLYRQLIIYNYYYKTLHILVNVHNYFLQQKYNLTVGKLGQAWMCSASIAGFLVHWAGDHNANRVTSSATHTNPQNSSPPFSSFISHTQIATYSFREERTIVNFTAKYRIFYKDTVTSAIRLTQTKTKAA